ncbi:MAG: thioredoxin domain-containing protein [Rickettsiaceae bacterium]|nr:thioredoxin domain-containing protein [Rickettsiaceae bacterium]
MKEYKFTRVFFCFLLIFCLSGCYEADFSTPAQNQINEYRKAGKMCRVKSNPIIASQPTPSTQPEEAPQVQQEFDESTIYGVLKDDVVVGNAEAKVVVVEYSSPTCLHCSFYHKEIYPKIKAKYIDSGKVAYVVRPFISNKQDLDSAILVRCVAKESFDKILEILYQKQDSWAFHSNYRDVLTNIGEIAGLSSDEYQKCLKDDNIADMLINHTRAITHVPGFLGTPSFMIDGVLMNSAYTFENLSNAIDSAIEKYEKNKQ